MTSQSTQRAPGALDANAVERRQTPRRLVRCRVALQLADAETLYGFSVDLTKDGMRIAVPRKVDLRQECTVSLNVHSKGRIHKISAIGEILSCVCSGMDGFQLGIRFVHLEGDSSGALDDLLS